MYDPFFDQKFDDLTDRKAHHIGIRSLDTFYQEGP
jgi:hypothetical protein